MNALQFRALIGVIILTQIIGFSIVGFGMTKETQSTHENPVDSSAIASIRDELSKLRMMTSTLTPSSGQHASLPPDAASLQSTIQAVLKEELGNIAKNISPQGSQVANTSSNTDTFAAMTGSNETPTEAQQEAMVQSRQVFDEAISRGTWKGEDNMALLPYANTLTDTQKIQLLNVFMEARENNGLVIEGAPPPL